MGHDRELPRRRPCIVYLDTSDFSRFGDVLRGKADPETERLYHDLLELKGSGKAVFPVSMPHLSELLQYNSEFRDTTFCKAEAVEALCGQTAFIFPSRMLALEIAQVAYREGLIDRPPADSVLSTSGEWYPSIPEVFDDLQAQAHDHFAKAISDVGPLNRKQRKLVEAKLRGNGIVKLVDATVPRLANQWGLSPQSIRRSVVARLTGKATSEQASRAFFSEIAKPTKFVDVYFERYSGDSEQLPSWLKSLGVRLSNGISKLRPIAEEFRKLDAFAKHTGRPPASEVLEQHARARIRGVSEGLVRGARRQSLGFGISENVVDAFSVNSGLREQVPTCQILEYVVLDYVIETGISAGGPTPEKSVGGDLIHLLYIGYADLWRGDRRFSHLVKRSLPALASKVVPRLSELPARIRKLAD